MKITSLKNRPVVYKFFLVALCQIITYTLLMVLPIRSVPLPVSVIRSWIIWPIVVILILFWVLFLVDQVGYWLIGIPIIHYLAMLYSSNNTAYFAQDRPGGGSGSAIVIFSFNSSEEMYILALFVFSIQCTICVGKWKALKLVEQSKLNG